mmetsp:Transcript_3778/g.8074  ORF Transcript_3778/g.8074 Transcript_3778/m.8074 type:complete len:429 (+) Transcript_3778:145-1431(+)
MVKVPLDYPIGTPGQSWGPSEKYTWLSSRQVRRSYHDDVVRPLYDLLSSDDHGDGDGDGVEGSSTSFSTDFEIVQYGELHVPRCDDCDGDVNRPPSSSTKTSNSLPLLAVKSKSLTAFKPTVLITGGTHGYETSGVLGALSFLTSGKARYYHNYFNVVVVPCVCPWGYERVERWVAEAVDPNRSFERASSDSLNGGGSVSGELLRTRESNQLIEFLDSLQVTCTAANVGEVSNGGMMDAININSEECDKPLKWLCHMDLHETTDSDFTEFRPAKAARDGGLEYDDHIPDGFYLVGDSERMEGELSTGDDPVSDHSDGGKRRKQLQMGFYQAILNAVERVTHIAEMEDYTDGHGKKLLSGYPAESKGLILVPCRPLGLCAGGAVPSADYLATTEVYPDSERTNGEECTRAQVESVCGGLDYLLETVVGS